MLVVFPGIQIGSEAPTPGLKPYTAQQLRGRHVYIEQGCLYCHSQQPRSADHAPDEERGWGRAPVASDYAYDHSHLTGTMRHGPDLLNARARLPSLARPLPPIYTPLTLPKRTTPTGYHHPY